MRSYQTMAALKPQSSLEFKIPEENRVYLRVTGTITQKQKSQRKGNNEED
jgi:hypothetical protein